MYNKLLVKEKFHARDIARLMLNELSSRPHIVEEGDEADVGHALLDLLDEYRMLLDIIVVQFYAEPTLLKAIPPNQSIC